MYAMLANARMQYVGWPKGHRAYTQNCGKVQTALISKYTQTDIFRSRIWTIEAVFRRLCRF